MRRTGKAGGRRGAVAPQPGSLNGASPIARPYVGIGTSTRTPPRRSRRLGKSCRCTPGTNDVGLGVASKPVADLRRPLRRGRRVDDRQDRPGAVAFKPKSLAVAAATWAQRARCSRATAPEPDESIRTHAAFDGISTAQGRGRSSFAPFLTGASCSHTGTSVRFHDGGKRSRNPSPDASLTVSGVFVPASGSPLLWKSRRFRGLAPQYACFSVHSSEYRTLVAEVHSDGARGYSRRESSRRRLSSRSSSRGTTALRLTGWDSWFPE